MGEFEQWFADQDFYTNMRFIHGDNLFSKDGDVYRVLPVQIAHKAWGENKSKIEQLEKIITARDSQLTGEIAISTKWISEYLRMAKKKAEVIRLVNGLRNEFDLWSDDGEGFDAIEAQIEMLEEALRGECG